mmetsp:Transcript_6136/g.25003  ORF Transcript_6136/g.25003 Transcript_6136/m.25003 type:complete len:337 (-) Transcript_6136:475-1485(-)
MGGTRADEGRGHGPPRRRRRVPAQLLPVHAHAPLRVRRHRRVQVPRGDGEGFQPLDPIRRGGGCRRGPDSQDSHVRRAQGSVRGPRDVLVHALVVRGRGRRGRGRRRVFGSVSGSVSGRQGDVRGSLRRRSRRRRRAPRNLRSAGRPSKLRLPEGDRRHGSAAEEDRAVLRARVDSGRDGDGGEERVVLLRRRRRRHRRGVRGDPRGLRAVRPGRQVPRRGGQGPSDAPAVAGDGVDAVQRGSAGSGHRRARGRRSERSPVGARAGGQVRPSYHSEQGGRDRGDSVRDVRVERGAGLQAPDGEVGPPGGLPATKISEATRVEEARGGSVAPGRGRG